MLFTTPQTTLAFAPEPEDLEEVYFDSPVIAFTPSPGDEEESEQGEP
ncbi:hypothetical protein [Tabrizicola flagellatus]|nr:hypothetical protein [Tabrizicola flagellatus]